MVIVGQTNVFEYDPVVLFVGLVIGLVSVVISFMKGKPIFALLGLFSGLFSIIGAFRIAKPDSQWAAKYYDPHGPEMRLARERFEGIPRVPSL